MTDTATELKKRPLGPVIYGGKTMPYGKGVIANGFVFLTGLDGMTDDDGNPVEGIVAQTRLAFNRGKQRLEEAGTTFENVVKINQYLARREDWEEYHRAREAWLAENAPQTLADHAYGGVLVIQEMTRPERLIEFEVDAVL